MSTLAGSADASRVISQPGAYYLTTNLVTVEFKHGIKIEASDVTLDLNGFSVIGGAESRDGITVRAFQTNITIINGIVTGWTNRYGIYCANVYGGTFEHFSPKQRFVSVPRVVQGAASRVARAVGNARAPEPTAG